MSTKGKHDGYKMYTNEVYVKVAKREAKKRSKKEKKHPEYPHIIPTSFTIQSSSRANKTKHYCRNFRYITFIYTKKK